MTSEGPIEPGIPKLLPTTELSHDELRIERAISRSVGMEYSPLLKVICAGDSEPSQAIIAKMLEAGFHVLEVTPERVNDPAFMKMLDGAIYSQQYYSDFHRAPMDEEIASLGMKVAVVFHHGMFDECCKNADFRYNWQLNSGYGQTHTIA